MSEIPAITSDASMPHADVSEELSEAQVKGLVEEATGAIKEGNCDRCIEIIVRLSQVHHQAHAPKGWIGTFRGWVSGAKCPVSNSDLFNLFSALCRENHELGKTLLPILDKNFTIEADGNHYTVSAEGFGGSFTIPIITAPEAKTLMNYLAELNYTRKFEALSQELRHLAHLCEERKVEMMDFMQFYFGLVNQNSTFAMRCIPLFKGAYNIEVKGNRLTINDLKIKESSSFVAHPLSLLNYDQSLGKITAEKDLKDRIMGHLYLARHQMERAPELIRKAEGMLGGIADFEERCNCEFAVMTAYMRNHYTINFERMAVALEEKISGAEDSEKKQLSLARLSSVRAFDCLEKRDRTGFTAFLVKLKEAMQDIKEEKPLAALQKELELLESKSKKVFPLDQMELNVIKV